MADPSESSEDRPGVAGTDGERADEGSAAAGSAEDEPSDASPGPETLRERVEERYDFEQFTPADMAEMTVEEWEAAFDPDTWITGPELLDRVEADLRSRVARREVFAVVERTEVDGEECVLAYTDVGYAVVGPDGSVRGEGSIVEDVEPVVALCSMENYDVPEPPADAGLPDPDQVDTGAGSLGDRLLLAVAVVQIVAGLALLLSPLVVDLGRPGGGSSLLTAVAGLGFLFIGIVIGVLVANARLSGRFRAEEYRRRLQAAGVGTDERPTFLPGEGERGGGNRGDDDPGEGTADGDPDRADGPAG